MHTFEPPHRYRTTRRAVLAAAGAVALSGVAAATETLISGDLRRHHLARRATAAPHPGAEPPPPPPPPLPPPAPIPGVVPIPPVAKPVFKVHDYVPNAPPNAVALTIDDGPDPMWTPKILAVLKKFNVKATFSLVGREVLAKPDLVRKMVAEGHGITNHSMTHPQPFAALPEPVIVQEISAGMQAIFSTTGQIPRLFRSPAGDWSPVIFNAVAQWGMTPIDWDVDPKDWQILNPFFITRKLMAARPGDILLCHDGGGNRAGTYMALRTVIPALQQRGLQFIVL